MVLASQLGKDDLKRAFDYLRRRDNQVVKIVSNPVFESLLFDAGVGVPVEFNETELGMQIVGKEGPNDYGDTALIRVFSEEGFVSFKETVACCSDRKEPDQTVVRVWRWEDAPACLKQFSEHGGDEDWVLLIPPALSEVNIDWLDNYSQLRDSDCYLLPGGWQVYIVAH